MAASYVRKVPASACVGLRPMVNVSERCVERGRAVLKGGSAALKRNVRKRDRKVRHRRHMPVMAIVAARASMRHCRCQSRSLGKKFAPRRTQACNPSRLAANHK